MKRPSCWDAIVTRSDDLRGGLGGGLVSAQCRRTRTCNNATIHQPYPTRHVYPCHENEMIMIHMPFRRQAGRQHLRQMTLLGYVERIVGNDVAATCLHLFPITIPIILGLSMFRGRRDSNSICGSDTGRWPITIRGREKHAWNDDVMMMSSPQNSEIRITRIWTAKQCLYGHCSSSSSSSDPGRIFVLHAFTTRKAPKNI